jgi:hypothetical protein
MRNEFHSRIPSNQLLVNQEFSFYVLNKSFKDANGNFEVMDLVVHDADANGQFEILNDRVLVGPVTKSERWAAPHLFLTSTYCQMNRNCPSRTTSIVSPSDARLPPSIR